MSAQKTLVINRQSWYMRWLGWVFDELPPDTSFCLLFWMLVLSPVLALGKLVLEVLGFGAKGVTRGVKAAAISQRAADRVAASAQRHKRAAAIALRVFSCAMVPTCVVGFALMLYRAAWWALLIPGNVACLGFALWAIRDTTVVRVLAAGYHATKTRTCPLVQFADPEEKAAAA